MWLTIQEYAGMQWVLIPMPMALYDKTSTEFTQTMTMALYDKTSTEFEAKTMIFQWEYARNQYRIRKSKTMIFRHGCTPRPGPWRAPWPTCRGRSGPPAPSWRTCRDFGPCSYPWTPRRDLGRDLRFLRSAEIAGIG
jgi:hypothetical protein